MRQPKGIKMHECAAGDRKRTPNLTGDPDLDQSILKSKSKGLASKIAAHTSRDGYGPRTGYDGYHGYSGDD